MPRPARSSHRARPGAAKRSTAGAGAATRPVTLDRGQLAALLAVLERCEVEAESGQQLREAVADELE